jgi:2-methylcitrate dehydratase PrpD
VSPGPTAMLARHTVEASFDGVPARMVRKVRELLLDHLECAFVGSRTPLARTATTVVPQATDGATIVGMRAYDCA